MRDGREGAVREQREEKGCKNCMRRNGRHELVT